MTDLANKFDAIDITGAELSVTIMSASPVTANSIIGLAPSRPSPPTPSASPSPPSSSPPPTPKTTVDGGSTSAELWELRFSRHELSVKELSSAVISVDDNSYYGDVSTYYGEPLEAFNYWWRRPMDFIEETRRYLRARARYLSARARATRDRQTDRDVQRDLK